MTITDYLAKLGQDPALLEEHRAHPRTTMAANGLSQPDINLILAGDTKKIQAAVQKQNANAIVCVIVS